MAMTKKEKAYVEQLEKEIATLKAIAAVSTVVECPEPMFSNSKEHSEWVKTLGTKEIEGYSAHAYLGGTSQHWRVRLEASDAATYWRRGSGTFYATEFDALKACRAKLYRDFGEMIAPLNKKIEEMESDLQK